MTHEDLVRAIRAYAADKGVPASEVSRDRFRQWEHIPDGLYSFANTSGAWTRAKSEASRGVAPEAPLEVIPPKHRVKGVSTLVDALGNVSQQWIKTDSSKPTHEEVLEALLLRLPTAIPVREGTIEPPVGPAAKELLAVYPMGDPHIGLLAWKDETGASFDLKIAEDLMSRAIWDLVMRGPRTERALICNLGDYFHADGPSNATTAGTPQNVDGRWAQVLMIGLRIFVEIIDAALTRHDFVEVDNQIGNHDSYTSIMLAIALKAHYRNEPRVNIPVDPATRHYHVFGRNLIATTHGDRTKPEDLASIMAAERPAEWGATDHRRWLCGHVHHTSVKELRGCTVETFRTLAARDAWHAGQGYLSGRDMHRILIHSKYGEIGREVASVQYLMGGGR